MTELDLAVLGTDGTVGGPGGSPVNGSVGGGVASVAAADATITVGGTTISPTVKVTAGQFAASLTDKAGWQPSTPYTPGGVFTTLAGERRLVTVAYTSGATFAAADMLNTVRLGAPNRRPVTILSAQAQGVKFRGMTVVPSVAQNGNGYVYIGSQFSLAYVKTQVNAAISVGCNLIRLGTDDFLELSNATITLPAWLANVNAVLAYCLAQGVYVYVGGLIANTDFQYGTTAQQQAWIQGVCALAHSYPNVVGVDAINEVQDLYNTTAPTATQTAQVNEMARWIRAVTDLPLAFSMLLGGDGGMSSPGAIAWIQLLAGVSDYFNLHPYYSGVGQELTAASVVAYLQPYSGQMPVILGEVGHTQSDHSDNLLLGSRLTALRSIITQPWCAGAIAFASNDYNTTEQWGFFDASWGERTYVTWPLRTWPKRANPALSERSLVPSGSYATTLVATPTTVPNAQTLLGAAAADATPSAGDPAVRAVAEFTGLTAGDTVTASLIDADSGNPYATASTACASAGSTPDVAYPGGAASLTQANAMSLRGAVTTAASPTTGFGNVIVLPSGAYGQITASPALLAAIGGTSPWSAEIRFARTRSGVQETLVGMLGGLGVTGVGSWILYIDGSNKLAAVVATGVGGGVIFPNGFTSIVDTTEHVAQISYDGTNCRLFLDGTLQVTAACAGTLPPSGLDPLLVGIQGGPSLTVPFVGSLEELRVSKTARNTAAYTPAATPFSTDANTIGLYHCDTINNNVVTAVKTPFCYAAGATAQLQVQNSAARGNLLQAVRQTAYSGFGRLSPLQPPPPPPPLRAKAAAMYSAHSIASLNSIQTTVGRTFYAATVFLNGNPDWTSYETPWILSGPASDSDWVAWKKSPPAGHKRQLLLSIEAFPSSEAYNGSNYNSLGTAGDWLGRAASGVYNAHYTALAQHLVTAGVGDSVIRPAWEANGESFPWQIRYSWNATQLGQWVAMWRNIVQQMKAVAGNTFVFDWCINANYINDPNLTLANWYPGDDVVDIIGIDAYDSIATGSPPVTQPARFNLQMSQFNGIQTVLDFSALHGKPTSFPEWGLWTNDGTGNPGLGDDPTYVNGMAGVFANNPCAYQCYFDNGGALILTNGSAPLGLAAYKSTLDTLGAETVT